VTNGRTTSRRRSLTAAALIGWAIANGTTTPLRAAGGMTARRFGRRAWPGADHHHRQEAKARKRTTLQLYGRQCVGAIVQTEKQNATTSHNESDRMWERKRQTAGDCNLTQGPPLASHGASYEWEASERQRQARAQRNGRHAGMPRRALLLHQFLLLVAQSAKGSATCSDVVMVN
jgi:hypothetical protein